MPLPPLLSLRPVPTPGLSAAAYVPWVMVSRALAFLRTLLVARLLGEAGKAAFGIYQPALEFINPLSALVMFGAADVAERYTAAMLTHTGPLQLRRWLHRQWLRLALTGIGVSVLLLLTSPWTGVLFGTASDSYSEKASVILPCGITIALLALYQHLAATLRGMRAYGAAAGMEFIAALLLLVFSSVAAWACSSPSGFAYDSDLFNAAFWLLVAYAASVAVPFCLYASRLGKHLGLPSPNSLPNTYQNFRPGDVLSYAPNWTPPRLTRFAIWALVRLLLVMLFSFLSIWGVLYLSSEVYVNPLAFTASFSIPFRIAQLLAFLAVTLWASTYGIAARAHSHGQTRRAHAQLLRVGRLGTAALTLLAAALLLARPLFAFLLPAYAEPITTLLPPMLALFLWYGLASFCSTFSDLRESPQRGAAIWATAILFQVAGIALARLTPLHLLPPNFDPQQVILLSSAAGLLAALLITAPTLLLRPFKLTRATLPLALLTLAPAILFLPTPLVTWLAPLFLLATVLALLFSNLLLRPPDRRALRNWRTRRRLQHS